MSRVREARGDHQFLGCFIHGHALIYGECDEFGHGQPA